jgi:hypothetical protein
MLFSFPHLFLAWVFVRGGGCSSFIFFLSFKKINVLHVCELTKTMTKKVRATPHKACVCWLLCVGSSLSRACAVGWGISFSNEAAQKFVLLLFVLRNLISFYPIG